MKVPVEYLEFMWPMKHFLITCGDIQGESNIITLSFCMPASKEPPLIACAIGKDFYSSELINDTREFIVNVPPKKLKKEIYYCGYHSGYAVDKFKATELTAKTALNVNVPIINECIAHMECKVINVIETGDKNLFIGEVIEAYADESIVNGEKSFEHAAGEFPRKIYGNRFKNLE